MNDDSLARLSALAAANPDVALIIDRLLVESYEEFIEILYKDLDAVIQKTQERKQYLCDAYEDQITVNIVDLMAQRGYQAEHDTKIGGHSDIVIRGGNNSFLWLCEAKRDKGPAWLSQGMKQLSSRYSDGSFQRSHGGILIYCQGRFAKRTLNNWRTALAEDNSYENLVLKDCSRNKELAFVSTHLHEASGVDYHIRHMAVVLYHAPVV